MCTQALMMISTGTLATSNSRHAPREDLPKMQQRRGANEVHCFFCGSNKHKSSDCPMHA
ncbi:hypothetical protein BC940DRAFT_294077 [Gongronella butleri]|nr:hypothetical protein BC940DRAFT_294077 [Gongronella butleri]